MGMRIMSGGEDGVTTPPNPDPKCFKVLGSVEHGDYTVAAVHYPGCTAFNGVKILVWRDWVDSDIRHCGHLDPHFGIHTLAPDARFAPTPQAMDMLQEMVGDLRRTSLLEIVEEAL